MVLHSCRTLRALGLFAISIVVLAFGVGPTLTLTATRRIVPLFIVQLARMVFLVALTFLLGQGPRSDRGGDGESRDGCRHPRRHVGYSVPGTPVGRGDASPRPGGAPEARGPRPGCSPRRAQLPALG